MRNVRRVSTVVARGSGTTLQTRTTNLSLVFLLDLVNYHVDVEVLCSICPYGLLLMHLVSLSVFHYASENDQGMNRKKQEATFEGALLGFLFLHFENSRNGVVFYEVVN